MSGERLLEFEGRIKNLTQWGKEFGIGKKQIHWRLKNGWSAEDALTKPRRKMPRRLPQSIRKQKNTVRLKKKNKNRQKPVV